MHCCSQHTRLLQITPVIIVATVFLGYGLLSRRLENTSLTAPMIFTGVGLALALFWPDLLGHGISHGIIHMLAEVTLIFVLFSDAARIDLQLLKRDHNLPQRMLLAGMPVSIFLGAVLALMMFDVLGFWEAALLAAMLAPTDAALGQSVVSSKSVPVRIRQALNVESGLNDGIALPLVLVFASLASAGAQDTEVSNSAQNWIQFGLMQVTLGPLVGALIGYTGARLVDWSTGKDWMSESFEGIGALSMALIAFAGAELMHGNGFIAAFVSGLVFGNCLSHPCKFLYEFAEAEGQFFTLATFLVFGALAISLLGHDFHWRYVVYGLFSLILIRMIPVAISMIGARVKVPTIAFLGWFGPRGLASILFALLILENMDVPRSDVITAIVVATVLLSIFLHGVTAAPLSKMYGDWVSSMGECEEMKPVSEMTYDAMMSEKPPGTEV